MKASFFDLEPKTVSENFVRPINAQNVRQPESVTAKLSRLAKNESLGWGFKLRAMLATDNRTGKIWE